MAELTIAPRTSGALTLVVRVDGAAVSGAALVADVYAPAGRRIAVGVGVVDAGGGAYTLAIDPAWSTDAAGRPIQGVYWADVLVAYAGVQTLVRERWTVRFP